MNVVTRAVAAIPVRTSVGTWGAITDLLAPAGSESRSRLERITNIAAILITAEYTQQAPIVVMPTSGPRVRIRTVHGLDAAEALTEEITLTASPCAEPGWTLSLPCGVDDIKEIRGALRPYPGIEVHDVTEGINVTESGPRGAAEGWLINYEEMERP